MSFWWPLITTTYSPEFSSFSPALPSPAPPPARSASRYQGFLVGEGARDWAKRRGIPVVLEKSLISEKAAKLYKHYKRKLDSYRQSIKTPQQKRPLTEQQDDGVNSKRPHQTHYLEDHVTDT